MLIRSLTFAIAGLGLGVFYPSLVAADAKLLYKTCGQCHTDANKNLTRIPDQRKTPEAWHMTIFRMRQLHGLQIDQQTQQTLIQYLSDSQGLAPSETEGLRYSFDRNPAATEAFEGPVADMCGRCHTTARVALQRRTEEDWRLHVDFHVGQYPTIEYQAGGRDRDWYFIARDEIVPELAKAYPLETEAWTQWQSADKPEATGSWTVSAALPGQGQAAGVMSVTNDNGKLKVTGSLQTLSGENLPLTGSVNIYTGFEWRATVKVGDTSYRQILALSEDGSRLEGRHYIKGDDAMNAVFSARRTSAEKAVLAVQPGNIKAGRETDIFVVGSGLDESISVGTGLSVISSQKTDFGLQLRIKADDSTSGSRSIGTSAGSADIVVFQKLDRLTVEPAYAVSRVGGGGGSAPPAKAMFSAIGWLNGADGEAGTNDDIRVGTVDGSWSLAPWNEEAEALEDTHYVGTLDAGNGVFSPAVAGPNPDRPFSTNNAGNVKVVANYEDLTANAQMIVTVQRWNDPPIR